MGRVMLPSTHHSRPMRTELNSAIAVDFGVSGLNSVADGIGQRTFVACSLVSILVVVVGVMN